jgi:hypothetical protein
MNFFSAARLALAWMILPNAMVAATYTVNTVADAADTTLNGVCATAAGECSLRAALAEANNVAPIPGPTHQINFNIAGCPGGLCKILVGSVLPDIVRPVVIDGSTQPGNASICTSAISVRPAYKIALDGSAVFGIKLRLESGSSGSTIRGLNLQNFTDAISIIRSNSNTIACNFIGSNESGGAGLGSQLNAVILGCSSTGNTIGGATAGDGNLLSGAQSNGVQITGAIPCTPVGGTPDGNFVLGNYIGTLKDGATPFANAFAGVGIIEGTGPDNNLFGIKPNGSGGFLRAANIISGNGSGGFFIDDLVSGTVIAGNFIGTDTSGLLNVGNTGDGIYSLTSGGLRIGGPDPLDANKIAFNTLDGAALDTSTRGNRVQQNSIYSNGLLGIDLNIDDVTLNDAGDTDDGANTLLNFPQIQSTTLVGANLTVNYLVATPPRPLTVEFFLTDVGGTQGRTFIGSQSYTSAAASSATFAVAGINNSSKIVATTTDANGNTSEFSTPSFALFDRIMRTGFEDNEVP